MATANKSFLKFSLVGAWLLFTLSMVVWWLLFALSHLDQQTSTFTHQQRMLI